MKHKELSKPDALILFNPVCVVDPLKNPKRFNFARLGVKVTKFLLITMSIKNSPSNDNLPWH